MHFILLKPQGEMRGTFRCVEKVCERKQLLPFSRLWEEQPCQVSAKDMGVFRKDLENAEQLAISQGTVEGRFGWIMLTEKRVCYWQERFSTPIQAVSGAV